jgi:hypothetical protein
VGTAAAVIVIKEKHIVAAFREGRATTPETARSFDSLGVRPGIATERLRRRAVLRETGPGTYYLDEPSWEALRRLRRRLATTVVLITILLILVGVVRWGR